jgi:dihydrofolate synthase / folylpolyglutamate synthase
MKIQSIKTHKITIKDTDLTKILDQYLPKLKEGSIVAITSKIVSICEGNMIKIGEIDKEELIKKESELYLPPNLNRYNVSFAIKNSLMMASAGVDESNGNGYLIPWPKGPQLSANKVREYLANKYNLTNLGVIITDSKSTPLRWGVTGVSIAHSGFLAINDLIGTEDIFGKKLRVTKVNVADGLAGAAVLVMGEGSEQTPLSIIEDISLVNFQAGNPTKQELLDLSIDIEDDLYGSILKLAPWQKGSAE